MAAPVSRLMPVCRDSYGNGSIVHSCAVDHDHSFLAIVADHRCGCTVQLTWTR